MKKNNKKTIIAIGGSVVALIVILLVGIQLINSRKMAEGPQLDHVFMNTFPVDGSMQDMCDWLDEQGYEYTCADDTVTGVTPNEWSLAVEEWQYGLMISLYKEDVFNHALVYENCYKELEALYGNPVHESDILVRYAYGTIVVELRKYENEVSLYLYKEH